MHPELNCICVCVCASQPTFSQKPLGWCQDSSRTFENQCVTPLNIKSHWHPLAIDASLVHLNHFPNTLASWDLTWHSAEIGIVLGTQRGLNGMRKAGRHRWTSRHVEGHGMITLWKWSTDPGYSRLKWFTMPVPGIMTCNSQIWSSNDNTLHCGSKHCMILV